MTLDEQIEALKKYKQEARCVGLGWKAKQQAQQYLPPLNRIEELRRIAEGVLE